MSSRNRIAIVVDGSASLPPEGEGPHPFRVVPMRVHVGGVEYAPGRDVPPSEFYRIQRENRETPTTAAPSPGAFAEAFAAAAEEADSVLALTVARMFSSTYDSAIVGAGAVRESHPDVRIEVVDTETAGGGEGLVATAAGRAAEAGLDLDGVLASIRAVIPRVYLNSYMDTLYYSWKSGRTPAAALVASKIFNLKPLFEMHRGEGRRLTRARSAARARRMLIDYVLAQVGDAPAHVSVMHADAVEAAEEVRSSLEDGLDCAELYVSELAPVVGAHTGPGLVAIAYWAEADPADGPARP